jgi:hypothetical protein
MLKTLLALDVANYRKFRIIEVSKSPKRKRLSAPQEVRLPMTVGELTDFNRLSARCLILTNAYGSSQVHIEGDSFF